MKHFGDITKLNGAELPIVDIITGGSPCQDLSVAGKRAGLAGERSGLFMEQIRIIKEMRDESVRQLCLRGTAYTWRDIRPRYMVWENVPGAFSSNKGEDFRAVLEETAKVAEGDACIPGLEKWPQSGAILGNGWSIAWRVHDAQFWGVPQRRKRIALVADFGGTSAPEILFERKSVSGDIKKSREEGQEIAGCVGEYIDKAISFQERAGKPGGGKGILIQHERTGALSTLNNQSVLANDNKACVYAICSDSSNSMKSSNPHSGTYKANTTRTLDLNGGNPACNQGGMIVLEGSGNDISGTLDASYYKGCGKRQGIEREVVCVDQGAGKSSCAISDNVSPTLATTHDESPAVCYKDVQGFDAYNQQIIGNVAMPLRNKSADADHIPTICYSQDAYDKYSENEKSATIKQSGGIYGGGVRSNSGAECDRAIDGERISETRNTRSNEWDVYCTKTVGALCRVDYKGAGNQYVSDGKLIIQDISKNGTSAK